MTGRGRAVLGLGLVVYVVAWVFGSRALYPVATGLVAAVALAVGWVRLSARPPRVRRHGAEGELVEGDDVRIDLVVEPPARVQPPTLVAHEGLARLGARDVELRRGRPGRWVGGYVLRRVPRGRYPFETVQLSIEDPFGLARASLREREAQALLVFPRLVELRSRFSETGTRPSDGHRLLLRRPTGFELHSVRDHEEGESLRRVHWPSTARRGRLMVKELEDAPRDEVAVLLDGDASAVAGEPPDSSFDAAVRAAGSLLQAHVRHGRRAVLVVNSAARVTVQVGSAGADWHRALELLATTEPTARASACSLLEAGAVARSLDLVVVTSRLDPALVERLCRRALSRRGAAIVYVEPASFAGAPARRDAGLLRLHAAGVPVAVVRHGADLAAALSAVPVAEAVRA